MGNPHHIGFGERLKAAREELKMSGAQLGKGMQDFGERNASRQTISDWEAERHLPNVWQLRELCLKLHKSADYFIFGSLAPSPKVNQVRQAVEAVTASLSEAERADLFASITRPGAPDAVVEERIPVTRLGRPVK